MKPKAKPREFCSVAEGSCSNPAGFRCASGSFGNSEGPRTTWACPACGNPACKNCRKKKGKRMVCNNCAEDE